MAKRLSRLESHVVTLARSVAHLSSEMRSQSSLYQEMEGIKRDLNRVKETAVCTDHDAEFMQKMPDWEIFRGWMPSLTNPRRVNKLTRYAIRPQTLDQFCFLNWMCVNFSVD